MQGFTNKLANANDLLRKLERNFEKFKKSPADVYEAFDFFVTAEHLPDWIDSGKNVRKENELLRIVSHIANGAKHFKVKDNRHDSVDGIQIGIDGYNGDAGDQYEEILIDFHMGKNLQGLRTSALEVAEQVLAFWQERLNPDG